MKSNITLTIAFTAVFLLALAGLRVTGQSTDATQHGHAFGQGNTIHRNKGQHEAVWLTTALGYTNDYTDVNDYYVGVYMSTSSSGAPHFNYGDNAAEAIATLMDQGYSIQGAPGLNGQWGSEWFVVLVK